jgi:hypothetical protein
MENNEIVRIKKVEKLDGTYYYPQKRIWKTRWFSKSGYEWESFFLVSTREFGDILFRDRFVNYSCIEYESNILNGYKSIKKADHDCKEYLRVHHSDKVVKVWSLDEH